MQNNPISLWNKLPMRYKCAILFIPLHWLLFFITGYLIGGHPPLFLLLVEAPVLLVGWLLILTLKFIGVFGYFTTFTGELNAAGVIAFVFVASATYGFMGFIVGLLLEKIYKNR